MNQRNTNDHADKFQYIIRNKEIRRQRALKNRDRSLWFWFGTFGIVGWSVMIPTVAGIGLGIWLDLIWKSRISWTLTGTVIGVATGCLNAWYWVSKERKIIEEERNRE
ncbi:MAG: ATPase F0F1 [Elusimicrobia bacterium]|nr:ATPase F0F1 [Elusimicrobiota bacterium]MBD3411491.1 ATPase F0F1 [Elusimicrobiota bacterium]